MKGLVLKFVAVAVLLALCVMPVFADGETPDVTEDVVSVDVTWENVVFGYTVKTDWDYENSEMIVLESAWSSDKMEINLSSSSSCALSVGLLFTSAELGENVKEEILGVFEIDGEEVNSLLIEKPEEGSIAEKSVSFSIKGGKVTSGSDAPFSLGGITLTFSTAI